MQYSRSFFRAELNQLTLVHGIQSAIALALPLVIGELTGKINLSVLPSLAAFFIYLFLGNLASSYRDKFLAMLIATLGCGTIVALGTECSHVPGLMVLLTFPVVFLMTFMSIYGSIATAIGQPIIIFWLISSHLPGSFEVAMERFWLILLAGAWAMLLSLTGWFFYPYRPVQQALITSYRKLTHFLETVTEAEITDDDNLWDKVTSIAQYETGTAIALARTLWQQVHSTQLGTQPQGEQLLLLIQKITDMYREVIVLTEIIVSRGKTPQFAEIRPALHEALETLTEALKTLDDLLQLQNLDSRQKSAQETLTILSAVKEQVQDLEKKHRGGTKSENIISLHLPELLLCLRNLALQIDGMINLLIKVQKQEKVSLDSVPLTPRTLSFQEIWLSHWSFDSLIFSHALRLAVVMTFAMLISASLHWVRGYWMALTVLFVLKPDYGATMQRVVQRISGTVVGAILATSLILRVENGKILLLILIFVAALTGTLRLVNYAIFILLLTVIIIVILTLDHPAKNWLLADIRVFHTLLGGVLAVVSYYLWPLWQRRYLPQQMSILLQTSLTYFQTVGAAYQGQVQSAKTLDIMRRQAELAAANALATAERMSQEPKRFQADLEGIMILIVNVNSFINGVTTLRQYLHQFESYQVLPGLDLFQQQVTDTMENLRQILQKEASSSPLPNFALSLDPAQDYLQTLQENQSSQVQGVTFVVAELYQLVDKMRGMYEAIA